MDNRGVESCLSDADMERIECILCDCSGLMIMERKNLINHMAVNHRVQGDLNFVLAGCLMKRKEREDIGEIFQELINNIATSDVDIPNSSEEKEKINEDTAMQKLSPAEDQKQNSSSNNSSIVEKKANCEISNLKCPTKRAKMTHTQGYHTKQKKMKENKSEVARNLYTEINDKPPGQETFNCGVCDSSFANKRGLKKHRKTDCGIRFDLEESSLENKLNVNSKNGFFKKRHIASIEKPGDFQCVNCEIRFSSTRCLLKHKQVCHDELIDIFQTSEYFRNHPLSIQFWNGADEEYLESDPSLPEGWKVKIVKRRVPRNGTACHDKQFYKPGFKFNFRSHVAMMEYIKYMEMKKRKQMKEALEEKLKGISNRKNVCKKNLDDLPEYFKEHPSLITGWYGVESSLLEDPKLTGGWKIKLEKRKTGKPRRHFVTPDRKYVIRTIEGVLEYLQHSDVLDDNIETLLETLLQMKNNQYKVQVPLVIEEDLSKNIDVRIEAEERLKTDENKLQENRDRKTLKKSKSEQKESSADGGQNHDLSKSKFKLEDWGSECKDKIRRLGKYVGDLEVDPKLPYGWKVRLYGKNSKSSSKDYVTPDGKYYVRSLKAVVKYMKLSGNYSDFLIKNTADILGVDMLDIEIEEKKQPDLENKDSIEEMITAMDDEKLLKEVDDEITSSDHGCDKCDEYRTRDSMELVLHKRLFHGLS